jgi:hypothetical protein
VQTAIYVITLLFARLHGADPNGALPVARASPIALCRVLSSSHKPSREGTLDFTIARTRRGLSTVYANAVADLNDDGSVAAYVNASGRDQQEWIVRNVPLPVSGEGRVQPDFSIWFEFGDLSVNDGQARSVGVILTDHPLDLAAVQSMNELVAWDIESLPVVATGWGAEDQRGQRVTVHASSPSHLRAARDTVLSASASGPAVPDIGQMFNECGPTSAANSLLWLAEQHRFLSKLPAGSDGDPDTAQLVLDLMKAMGGTVERPFKGLKGNQMFAGLKAYVELRKLPLVVDGGNAEPASRGPAAFDFVAQHLSEREPAELLIWLADGSGHWVTVTGYARQEGRALLFVHDPDDKKSATAVWELSIGEGGKPDGDFIVPRHCSLGWAVAETPVQSRMQAAGQVPSRGLPQLGEEQPILFSLDVN